MKNSVKIFILIGVLSCIVSPLFAEDIIEKYDITNNWKRQITSDGSIYEYSDENLRGDEWNHYGKIILVHELSFYKTFNWSLDQVVVTEYNGDYVPVAGSAPLSDILLSERRISYTYDHHSEFFNLNTGSNGWVMRGKSIYNADGITLSEHFSYNSSGSMTSHSIYDASGNLLEEYLYDDMGRLIRNDLIASNLYYAYTYFGSLPNPRYKDEFNRSSNSLLNRYELISSDFYIKKEADGHIYSYTKIGSTWVTSTQLDPDGTVSLYSYDAGLTRTGVTKYYSDGSVEKLDGQWVLTEKIEQGSAFFKGGNLPWIQYGYDVGSRDPYCGFSGSGNKATLIDKMQDFAGGTVRVFLFTDLRDVIDFSGPTLRFYDEDKLYRDMDALIESARMTGTKLIPSLFDYWLAYGSAGGDSGHPEVIKDSVKRQQLMELLGRFIDHYKNTDEILMWDLMNEPYYGTSASPWGNGRKDSSGNYVISTVSVNEMSDFLALLLNTVRTYDPGKATTIGFANKEVMDRYWRRFIDGGADDIDIIQIHYWAKYYYYNFGELAFSADDPIFMGKPVFIGEIDPQYYDQSDPDFALRLWTIFNSGYAGGLFWRDDGNTQPITPEDMARIQAWYYGTRYQWDHAGNKITKTLPDGTVYEYDITPSWRMRRELKPNLSDTRWDYYGSTMRINTKTVLDLNTGLVTIFSYFDDANNLLYTKTDPDGSIYEYSNENWIGQGFGKLVKKTSPDGVYFLFESYYAGTNQAQFIKEFSAAGLLRFIREYFANGTLKRVVSFENMPQYTYDSLNRLSRIDYPDGAYTLYTYDGLSRRVLSYSHHYADGTSFSNEYTYYAGGVLKSARYTERSGRSTFYEYRIDGSIERVSYSDGSSVTYTYDGSGRILRIDYATGAYISYEYYADWKIKKVTNHFADGTNSYDEYTYHTGLNSWLIRTYTQTARDGRVTIYRYNTQSQLESLTRPDGVTESYTYDGSGRTIRTDFSDDGYDAFSYDGISDRITRIDHYRDAWHTYELFTYRTDNSLANRTVYYEDGTYRTVYYGNSGNPLRERLRDGRIVYYTAFDNMGRVTRKDISGGGYMTLQYSGSSASPAEITAYYADGLIASKYFASPDINGAVYYHYSDENFNGRGYGRVDKKVNEAADADGARYYEYEYWAGTEIVKTMRSYSSGGDLDSFSAFFASPVATYEYDEFGNLYRKTLPDGTVMLFGGINVSTMSLAEWDDKTTFTSSLVKNSTSGTSYTVSPDIASSSLPESNNSNLAVQLASGF